jgi:hypothetical protein
MPERPWMSRATRTARCSAGSAANRRDDPLELQVGEGGLFGGGFRGGGDRGVAEGESGATDALVADDPEHPGGERGGGAQGADLAVEDDEGLLGCVLGVLGSGAEGAGEALDVGMGAGDQRLDRAAVTPLGGDHHLLAGPGRVGTLIRHGNAAA